MDIFRNRPFMFCCSCFIAVSVVCVFLTGALKLLFVALSVFALIVILILSGLKKIRKTVCFVAVFALAFSAAASFGSFYRSDIIAKRTTGLVGESHSIGGTVLDVENESVYMSVYSVRIKSVDGVCTGGFNSRLQLSYGGSLKRDDCFTITADCLHIGEVSFSADYELMLMSDGIDVCFVSDEPETDGLTVTGNVPGIRTYFLAINDFLTEKLTESVGGEEGNLAAAVLLGARSRLSDSTVRDFGRSGIMHMLALSGMHLTIIAAIAGYFLRFFGISKRIRAVILPVLTLLYLSVIGFPVSAVRAAIMLSVVYILYLFSKSSDSLTSLFFACAAIIAFSPQAVTDMGLWMSFLSTAGIIITVPLCKRFCITHFVKQPKFLSRIFTALLEGAAVTVSANLAVLPFTWLLFGELSLAAVPVCILASFLVTAIIAFSVVLLINPFAILLPVLAETVRFSAGLLLRLTSGVSGLRGVTVSLNCDFVPYIIIPFVILAAVIAVSRIKRKKLILLAPLCLFAVFAVSILICRISVGNRIDVTYSGRIENEYLVMTKNGQSAVCDISDGGYYGLLEAYELAAENGATETEVLVLTHYHNRQISTLAHFASETVLRNLWLPEPETPKEYVIMKRLCETSDTLGIRVTVYEKGTGLTVFGNGKLTITDTEGLGRSEHGIVGVKIENNGERLSYYGSSYFESNGKDENLNENTYVIFGTHGPVPKLKYCSDTTARVLFADAETMSFAYSAPGTITSTDGWFVGSERFVFSLG